VVGWASKAGEETVRQSQERRLLMRQLFPSSGLFRSAKRNQSPERRDDEGPGPGEGGGRVKDEDEEDEDGR
jgi:hypothetical protein